ncbi:unnamed protein product [Plutella xylostella]|uniref:Conserved oligomeric Golgi complex subunit 4 n=1 Tax=Plutella xylostella TaxID=51655 RepID=A0A8S4F058_PLUXY|nr:unnamed protein product [Plutella xylostella]
MSLALLLEKYDVSTDEGLQKALHEIEKEELEVDEALSDVLGRSASLEGHLRAASQAYSRLGAVRADAEAAAGMVDRTAALARDVSAKVRQLDLARSRVAECQRRVHDLIDLQLCSAGVEAAIKAHDYETGAAHVSRFLSMDPGSVEAARARGAPDPRLAMTAAANTLRDCLVKKFAEAARAEDDAAVERLFRLFPQIGQPHEGVDLLANYLATQVDTIIRRVSIVSDPTSDAAVFADALTRVLEAGGAAVERARTSIASCAPGSLPRAVKPIQPIICAGARRIFTSMRSARQLGPAPDPRRLPHPPEPRAAEPVLAELALSHSRIRLYFAFLRRKTEADAAPLDEAGRAAALAAAEQLVAGCDLSGNLLYHREGDQLSQGGVGFIVNKSLVNNIVEIGSVSTRVAYLILRISKRYSMKVIQVYAPTSKHTDDEVELAYEDVSSALRKFTTHFMVVMGDFNAKLGKQEGGETKVGSHGFGVRNHRGQMLADFLEKEGLYMMNSFYKKKPQRKWTWISPDGKTKNEIDFILTDKKHIFNDVSVISRVKTGSDHRLVRGTLNINCKIERSRLMKSTLRPTPAQIQDPESFQSELCDRLICLENCVTVDDLNNRFVETVREVGSKYFSSRTNRGPQKLSDGTLSLIRERREMRLQSSVDMVEYRRLNRQIAKARRCDMRRYNCKRIQDAIEQNKGSKVFARDRSVRQTLLTQLKTDTGNTVSSVPEILGEIERFYGQLYTTTQNPITSGAHDSRAPLTRHYTEDIPDVSLDEISIALKQLKNNKAPGDDGITTELLKAGGRPILIALRRLFNSVILEGTSPEAWSRSVVTLFFKKGNKALLKNYRPIALLSHVYKLFSRVITNRLEQRLDDFQPPEQAGFRKGYSTIDHIHTLRQVIQKTEEYNLPLCLAFVDYEKAFDSIELWAMLQSLQRCHIDYRYIEVLR